MTAYLDNAATSFPKPDTVYTAIERYMKEVGASAGRGTYQRALEADRLVYETRRSLARLFGVSDASRIVFTSNATESLNLALKGWLRPGDHVITTSMEHNAMWRPLKTLEKEGLIELTSLPCQPDGTLILEKLPPAIRPNTRLIALTHASNVTGTLMPVAEISRIARKAEIPVLLDAAQTAGVYPLNVAELGIHLLAFTGHKGLLGPQGTGGLYISPEIDLKPLKEGGTGSESLLEYQPDTIPDRYEAGTLNVVGLVGLGAAVAHIMEVGIENIRQKEKLLTKQLLEGLASIAGLKVYGPCDPDRQVGVVSFNFEAIAPEEVAYALDEMYGIMVRAGLAMFLNEITVTFIEPCWADSGKVRLKAQLSANIGFLLPYLNAILPRAIYSQGSDNLTLMKEGTSPLLR